MSCFVMHLLEHQKTTAKSGKKGKSGVSESEKGVGYSWFIQCLLLPEEQKLEVLRLLIDSNYDMASANALCTKYRLER